MSPVALPQNGLDELKSQVEKVRQRLQGAGSGFQDFSRFAELSGARAIVAPGKSIVVRVLPRWDIAQHYIRKGDELVYNPKYPQKQRVVIFVGATAHWIVNPVTNKPQRVWCRLMLNKVKEGEAERPTERCPICEAAIALMSGSEDDKKMAKDIRGKECYLFNAVIRGERGTNIYNDKGEPDIRILNTPPTVWVAIIDTMTGGPEAQESFAKGEIFDAKEGYDLMITRPAQGGTDRYKVACANSPSPLFTAAEAPKWKAWTSKLHNLEAEVGPEAILSFNDMWKQFYGRDPDEGEGVDTAAEVPEGASDFGGGDGGAVDPGQFDTGGDAGGEAPPEFDGIGMPGAEEEQPAPPPPPRQPAKTAPPRPAAPRPVARRR